MNKLNINIQNKSTVVIEIGHIKQIVHIGF